MIPSAALRDRVTVDPFVGVDGMGADVFGTPIRNVKARIVDVVRQIRTGSGVDVVTVPQCQLRPGLDVAPQSRITRGSQCWTVLDVAESEPVKGWLLICSGFRL